jgi:hypothetical protein
MLLPSDKIKYLKARPFSLMLREAMYMYNPLAFVPCGEDTAASSSRHTPD